MSDEQQGAGNGVEWDDAPPAKRGPRAAQAAGAGVAAPEDAKSTPVVSEQEMASKRAEAMLARRKAEEERPAREGEELIQAAAKGERLRTDETRDALDWFLSDDPDDTKAVTHDIELNVGDPGRDKWIKWTIQPLDATTIQRIRREGAGPRAQRRGGGEVDDLKITANLVVAATVYPDLRAAAARMKNPADGSTGVADPSMALRMRFDRMGKPGLLNQIVGHIMSISGFDDEDVREAKEVMAAGS